MPHVQVDTGAIKFILSGADIMCPGLTSAGGRINPELAKDTMVAVMAEGKDHALAIGILKMSGTDMYYQLFHEPFYLLPIRIKINQGHGIESVHFLNDGLWRMPSIA